MILYSSGVIRADATLLVVKARMLVLLRPIATVVARSVKLEVSAHGMKFSYISTL